MIAGVVKDVPVPRLEPPVAAAYQFNVPALAVAPKVIVPPLQPEPAVVPVIAGVVVMLAVAAVLAEVQPLLVTST